MSNALNANISLASSIPGALPADPAAAEAAAKLFWQAAEGRAEPETATDNAATAAAPEAVAAPTTTTISALTFPTINPSLLAQLGGGGTPTATTATQAAAPVATADTSGTTSPSGSTASSQTAPTPEQATQDWQNSDAGTQATTAWQKADNGSGASGYQTYQADLAKGDGNAMVEDIHNALQSGTITSAQATILYQQAQSNASANGGGTINGHEKDMMAQDIAAPMVASWSKTDPAGAAKFQADWKNGDGNAMVQDIHDALQSGAIKSSDATGLYSYCQQIASANGGGKINSDMKSMMSSDTLMALAPQWQALDPDGFQKFAEDMAKGDGNTMVEDVHQAIQAGVLSATQGAQLYGQIQTIASANGGGKLNSAAHATIDQDAPNKASVAAYQKYLADGDGNAMVEQINNAMNTGALSTADATALFADAEQAAAKNGGGNLGNSQRVMVGNAAGPYALAQWQKSDASGYAKYQQDIKNGDGNAMVQDIHNALVAGTLNKAQATALYLTVPTTANAHGGGKCDSEAWDTAKADTGDDRILAGGETHAMHEFKEIGLKIIGGIVGVLGLVAGGAGIAAAAGIEAAAATTEAAVTATTVGVETTAAATDAAVVGTEAATAAAETGTAASVGGTEAATASAEVAGTGAEATEGAGAAGTVATQSGNIISRGIQAVSNPLDTASSGVQRLRQLVEEYLQTGKNIINDPLGSAQSRLQSILNAPKNAAQDPWGSMQDFAYSTARSEAERTIQNAMNNQGQNQAPQEPAYA